MNSLQQNIKLGL